MRLNKKQKELIIQWIAEGIQSDEMNHRAAKMKPPFSVSKTQVVYYRDSRGQALEDVKRVTEFSAIKSGLALVDARVEILQRLANKLIVDLLPEDDSEEAHKRWLLQVKGIGNQTNYERVEYYEFNRSEIEALRGLLDDIAAEIGDRSKKQGANLNIDLSKLTDAQLERIANGEDPIQVIANA